MASMLQVTMESVAGGGGGDRTSSVGPSLSRQEGSIVYSDGAHDWQETVSAPQLGRGLLKNPVGLER